MAVSTAKPPAALGAEAQQILSRPQRGLWADAWIRLRRNKALMPDDLLALEQMLLESGAGDDKAIAKANGGKFHFVP